MNAEYLMPISDCSGILLKQQEPLPTKLGVNQEKCRKIAKKIVPKIRKFLEDLGE